MNAKERKERPVFTGVLKYFPLAIMEIARVSLQGNKQHHPDKPLHWDRSKSKDDYDALARHLIDAGTVDSDGIRYGLFCNACSSRRLGDYDRMPVCDSCALDRHACHSARSGG